MEIVWKDNTNRGCVVEHKDYFLALVVVKGVVLTKMFDNGVNNLQQAATWVLEHLK